MKNKKEPSERNPNLLCVNELTDGRLCRSYSLNSALYTYSFIATSQAPQITVRRLPTFALSPTT